jgi:enterochelin esterase-like enzyme
MLLRLNVATLALALLAACATSPQPDAPRTVVLEKVIVHGPSLEGNLLGESPDRDVFVYLPPSYASSPRKRYPVVVSLHGFGGSGESYTTGLGAPEAFDRAIAAGANEMIVVIPDARTSLIGSMFSSSVTTGDWESFIADDLIAYVDANYRTLAARESRGLSGFSMGGYGTVRIAMKRPDAFSSIYVMSACCLPPQVAVAPEPGSLERMFSDFEGIQPEQVESIGFGAAPLAMAAAWSPNPSNPPFYIDWLTKDGQAQPDVIASWAANAPIQMVHQYVPALKSLDAIAMEIGLQDSLLAGNEQLHEILDGYGIAHSWETYEGNHGDKIQERFEQHALPFFSEHLTFEE